MDNQSVTLGKLAYERICPFEALMDERAAILALRAYFKVTEMFDERVLPEENAM